MALPRIPVAEGAHNERGHASVPKKYPAARGNERQLGKLLLARNLPWLMISVQWDFPWGVRSYLCQGRSHVILPSTPIAATAISSRAVVVHATYRFAFRGGSARRTNPAGLRRRRSQLRTSREGRVHAGRHLVGLFVASVVQRRESFMRGRRRAGCRAVCGSEPQAVFGQFRRLLQSTRQTATGCSATPDTGGGGLLPAKGADRLCVARCLRPTGCSFLH